MTSRRSALRTWVGPPTFISDNPRLRRSSTIENRHNANTPWPPGRRHLAGRRSRSRCRRRPRAFRLGIVSAMASPAHRRSRPRHVGIVLGLEVSASPATMPIGIACSISAASPTPHRRCRRHLSSAMFNDRLLLGLKGTMSEAELHIIRAVLTAGFAQGRRGELRRGLPVGFIWGEEDGEVASSDEAVCYTIVLSLLASRTRIGTPRLALVPQRGPVVSLQTCYGGTSLGETNRHYHVLSIRLCGRLCLWQEPPRSLSMARVRARTRAQAARSQWCVIRTT